MPGHPSGIVQLPPVPGHSPISGTMIPLSGEPPPFPFKPPAAAASTRRRIGTTATTNPSLTRMGPPACSCAGQPSIQALDVSIDFATSLRWVWDVPSDSTDCSSATVVGGAPALPLQRRAEPLIPRQFRGESLLAALRQCFASTLVFVSACSGTGPVDVPERGAGDAGPFSLSGYVLKGPVSDARVTAYKLHPDLTTGDALASATTDETGFFGLEFPPYNGDVLLVAAGGTYADEALSPGDDGEPRRLTLDRELLGVALDVQTGQPATANITPI